MKKFNLLIFLAVIVLVICLSGGIGILMTSNNTKIPISKTQLANNNAIQAPKAQSEKTQMIQLKIRRYVAAVDTERYDTELDSRYRYDRLPIDKNKIALLLMDVWEYHPNDGWLERAKVHIKQKIKPLVEYARENNMRIIHVAHSREISSEVKPMPGEYELIYERGLAYDRNTLIRYLNANGIDTLLYAGYATNMCVTFQEAGLFHMNAAGFRTMIIRDCVIAFETPETLEGEWANKVVINMVETMWGASTTFEDLKAAVQNSKIPDTT